MDTVDYLIIGGGIAGTTAAKVLREHDQRASIQIVTAESYPFYSHQLLSKPAFYTGAVPFDAVFLKPRDWFRKHNVGTMYGDEAVALDTKQKLVTLKDGRHTTYRKLLLALGVAACPWKVPGADKDGIWNLRTLDDAKHVIASVKTAKHALVIGGGFIGFEMCNILASTRIKTTLAIREKYFWEPLLDEASGRMIETALKRWGVAIRYGTLVEEVLGNETVEAVRFNTGETLETDLIICGIGTQCAVDWVSRAGIASHRGILTNEYLETSVPGVWAAGDAAEYKDLILDEHIQFGNRDNAEVQGKVAALNMLGQRQPYHHVSHYTARGPGISIAFIGDVRVLEGREVIARGSPAENAYTRIVVLVAKGEVEGATMVNREEDLEPLTKIIEDDVKITPFKKQLGDPSFDLRTIAG